MRAGKVALLSVLVAAAASPATAAAGGWRVAGLTGAGAPRAAVADATGGFTLLTGGRSPDRWSWPPGAVRPTASAIAAPESSDDSETPWAANSRGDALLIDRRLELGDYRVVAVDVNGASSATIVRSYRVDQRLPADIGQDGTAAVADEFEDGTAFGLSIRPPGGQWGPVAVVRGPDYIDAFTLRVLADGRVAVVFASAGQVFVTHARAGADPDTPVAIASGVRWISNGSNLMLAAGGDRVAVDERSRDGRVVELHRRGDTWTPARELGFIDSFTAPAAQLAQTPDGRALLVAFDGRDLLAWRSAPGAPLGAPVGVARVKRGWTAVDLAIDESPGGDATIAWSEVTNDDTRRIGAPCEGPCHARVRALQAPATGPLGAPVLVSPLGTANIGRQIVSAIQASGERLLAWQADTLEARQKVMTARGAPGPDPPVPADTRAPRLKARVATLRNRRFAMRLGCGERCAVAVSVIPPASVSEETTIRDLPVAVVNRPQIVRWRLTAIQRRSLRRLLSFGSVRVFVKAVDAAGNKRTRVIPARPLR